MAKTKKKKLTAAQRRERLKRLPLPLLKNNLRKLERIIYEHPDNK